MEVNTVAFEDFKAPNVLPEKKNTNRRIGTYGEKCTGAKPDSVFLRKKDRKSLQASLSYSEPSWGGTPPSGYNFEVLKCGTIISTIPVSTSMFVFGRLDNCNVVLEHPSVSRFHAILQYCSGDEAHPRGFYIYDLGSTHGTSLNKKQIQSKVYTEVKVGHVLRFGGSSRLYIFQGPDDDSNNEDIVINIKESKESEICDWGMAEDADEEEDLTENPYALSTANEELYLDDPKKTLRGWFEREGYDLDYIVEEKGFRTFSCRVQLPIDSMTGELPFAEASVTGKKKEAVIACALEACRILDRRGLLRQSQHESKKKKKKNWEEDDFYDSDEDTFLDRTGVIEKKREIRKKLVSKPEVETHQSLTSKLDQVVKSICEIEKKLQSCASDVQIKSQNDETDSLEMYMSQIENPSNDSLDKITKSKLRLDLSMLKKERIRLETLVNITKPTLLPLLIKTAPIIGKRPIKKPILPPPKKLSPKVESSSEEQEDEISEDINQVCKDEAKPSIQEKEGILMNFVNDSQKTKETGKIIKTEEFISSRKTVIEEKAPASLKKVNILQNTASLEIKKRATEKPNEVIDVYKENNADYSMWIPPDDQTGDGKTYLNTKYGY